MRKGQITIFQMISVGVGLATAFIGNAFYQSDRTGKVETRTTVLEVQYSEVNKKLDRILNILDKETAKVENKPLIAK